jgi:hypothetical protein
MESRLLMLCRSCCSCFLLSLKSVQPMVLIRIRSVRTSEKTGRGAKGFDAGGFQRSLSDPVQKKFLRLNEGQFL